MSKVITCMHNSADIVQILKSFENVFHNAFDHVCLHPAVTIFSEVAYVVETVSKDLSDHTTMGAMRTEELDRTKIGKGIWKPGARLVGIRDFLQQGEFVRCLLRTGKRFGSFA